LDDGLAFAGTMDRNRGSRSVGVIGRRMPVIVAVIVGVGVIMVMIVSAARAVGMAVVMRVIVGVIVGVAVVMRVIVGVIVAVAVVMRVIVFVSCAGQSRQFTMQCVIGDLERQGVEQSQWAHGHAGRQGRAFDTGSLHALAEEGHGFVQIGRQDFILRIEGGDALQIEGAARC
jgi:hypothetical protein